MQYWFNSKKGILQRLEEVDFKKRPDMADFLQSQGYIRVMSETDYTEYKAPLKKKPKRKKKKK